MTQMWVIKAFEAADGSGSNTSSRLFQLLELGHAGAWRWRGREPTALPVPVCRRAAGSSLPWGCARCSAGTGQLQGGCSKGSACSWCKFKPRALLPWESSCPVKLPWELPAAQRLPRGHSRPRVSSAAFNPSHVVPSGLQHSQKPSYACCRRVGGAFKPLGCCRGLRARLQEPRLQDGACQRPPACISSPHPISWPHPISRSLVLTPSPILTPSSPVSSPSEAGLQQSPW